MVVAYQLGHEARAERKADANGEGRLWVPLAVPAHYDPSAVVCSVDAWMMTERLHRPTPVARPPLSPGCTPTLSILVGHSQWATRANHASAQGDPNQAAFSLYES
jgi:hypothetical protein